MSNYVFKILEKEIERINRNLKRKFITEDRRQELLALREDLKQTIELLYQKAK